jgi:Cytochrome oxidase c assembly
MSQKRPSDTFTRFTANSPHAAQKAPSSFSSNQPPNPTVAAATSSRRVHPRGPDGETPAEKVARLRMQSRAEKINASMSPVDRFLVRGRRWADNMHRVTTYGLLGLAALCSVTAIYGVLSLSAHTRTQKRAFVDRELNRLLEAQQAFLRGEANAEQLHLLEMERAGDDIEAQHQRQKELKKTDGVWAKVKGFAGIGAATGDMGPETPEEARVREMRHRGRERVLEQAFVEGEIRPAAVQQTNIEGVGLDSKGRPVPLTKMERVPVGERKRDQMAASADEVVSARIPGPLDVLAGNIAGAVSPSKSSRS